MKGWLAQRIRSLRSVGPVTPREDREPRIVMLLPILIVVGWWLLSLVVYLIGWPIPYTRVNWPLVALLVASSAVAAFMGFVVVAQRLDAGVRPIADSRLPRVVLVGVVATVALLLPWAAVYSGYQLWELAQAVFDQGEAFRLSSERIAEGRYDRLAFIALQTIAAPFTLTVVPFAALAWFERRQHGWVLLVGVAAQLVMSLLVGRDIYVVTTLVLIGAAWFVARVRARRAPSRNAFIGIAAIGALFVVAFGARKHSRGPSAPLCPPGADVCAVEHAPTLLDSIVVSLASYTSQSMEGLGRAFEGDWVFGGGYRHAPALAGAVETIFGGHPTRVITDQLVEHEWSDSAYWSTGFAWIANDVPWVLVPVIVGLLAAFLAWTWRRVVRDADWLSITVFAYGWLVMFFLAQNNQITTSGPTYIGYLVLSALFIIRDVRSRRRHTNERMPRTRDSRVAPVDE